MFPDVKYVCPKEIIFSSILNFCPTFPNQVSCAFHAQAALRLTVNTMTVKSKNRALKKRCEGPAKILKITSILRTICVPRK